MPLATLIPRVIAEIDWLHDPNAQPYVTMLGVDSPYAWLRLQEASGTSLADASGHSHPGTLTTATGVTYHAGTALPGEPADFSLAFASTNEIALPAGMVDGWDGSWEAWVYPTSNADDMIIFSTGAGSTDNIIARLVGGAIYMSFSGYGVGGPTSAAGVLPLNTWSHVVVVYQSSGIDTGPTVYVNGVQQLFMLDYLNSPPSNLKVGRETGLANPRPWIGRLDELATYNGVLLSATRVGQHFRAAANSVVVAPTYTDASDDVAGSGDPITFSRGRSRQLQQPPTGTGGMTLLDRKRDYEPEFAGSQFYPNVEPSRRCRVRMVGASGYGPGLGMFTSGFEITDARRAGVTSDGDGVLNDSSFGLWPVSGNMLADVALLDVSFEANINGWQAIGAGCTLTRESTAGNQKFGSWAAKLVTGAVITSGIQTTNPFLQIVSNTNYGISAWVKAPAGQAMQIGAQWYNGVTGVAASFISFTGTGAWQYVAGVVTSPVATVDRAYFQVNTNSATAVTFWVDGVQFERKGFATPFQYTARGGNARVQGDAGGLDETQGWVAFRIRPGWAAADSPYDSTNPVYLLDWADSVGERISLLYDPATDKFQIDRKTGAAGTSAVTAAQSFARATTHTVIAAWTSTQVKISIDGVAFVTASNTSFPVIASPVFEVGSSGNRTTPPGVLGGELLWFAAGTGTLTDGNATTINGLGDTDKVPTDFPGTALLVWQALDYTTLSAPSNRSLLVAYNKDIEPVWPTYRKQHVPLALADAMGLFSEWPVSASFGAQLTGARAHAILDKVGWATMQRRIDPGLETMAAETVTNAPAQGLLLLCADSEGGLFYIDEEGIPVFQQRNARLTAARSTTSRYTFGDGGPSTGELPYVRLTPSRTRDNVVNNLSVAWSGGTVTASDQPSIDRVGGRSDSRTTRLSTSGAASAQAANILAAYKELKYRFDELVLDPARDPNVLAAVLDLRISDRITVKRRPMLADGTIGAAMTRDVYIESVSPSLTMGTTKKLTVTYRLSPVTGVAVL